MCMIKNCHEDVLGYTKSKSIVLFYFILFSFLFFPFSCPLFFNKQELSFSFCVSRLMAHLSCNLNQRVGESQSKNDLNASFMNKIQIFMETRCFNYKLLMAKDELRKQKNDLFGMLVWVKIFSCNGNFYWLFRKDKNFFQKRQKTFWEKDKNFSSI